MFSANKVRGLRELTALKQLDSERNQPSLSIFSRAALAKNAERVSPRAAAASSIAVRRPASSVRAGVERTYSDVAFVPIG
jgi:hypothetical protein